MSNDRELLELAAKAGDVELGDERTECGISLTMEDGRHRSLPKWNPLTDDGDALRLAVKLNICVFNNEYASWAATGSLQEVRGEELHNGGVDPYTATRRAIVRAASEIGRAKP